MAIPKKIREKVWNKCNRRCAYCGRPIEYRDMQIDHVIPKRRGTTNQTLAEDGIIRGEDSISNYLPSCRSCNHRKGELNVDDFRTELRLQKERAIKNYPQVRQSIDYNLFLENEIPIIFYFEKIDIKRYKKLLKGELMLGKKIIDLEVNDTVNLVFESTVEIERFKVIDKKKTNIYQFHLKSLESSKEIAINVPGWFEYSDIRDSDIKLGRYWVCSDREDAKMRMVEAWYSKHSREVKPEDDDLPLNIIDLNLSFLKNKINIPFYFKSIGPADDADYSFKYGKIVEVIKNDGNYVLAKIDLDGVIYECEIHGQYSNLFFIKGPNIIENREFIASYALMKLYNFLDDHYFSSKWYETLPEDDVKRIIYNSAFEKSNKNA